MILKNVSKTYQVYLGILYKKKQADAVLKNIRLRFRYFFIVMGVKHERY